MNVKDRRSGVLYDITIIGPDWGEKLCDRGENAADERG
jgi:hypothetical protein